MSINYVRFSFENVEIIKIYIEVKAGSPYWLQK